MYTRQIGWFIFKQLLVYVFKYVNSYFLRQVHLLADGKKFMNMKRPDLVIILHLGPSVPKKNPSHKYMWINSKERPYILKNVRL